MLGSIFTSHAVWAPAIQVCEGPTCNANPSKRFNVPPYLRGCKDERGRCIGQAQVQIQARCCGRPLDAGKYFEKALEAMTVNVPSGRSSGVSGSAVIIGIEARKTSTWAGEVK